jgi:hypothetical protein
MNKDIKNLSKLAAEFSKVAIKDDDIPSSLNAPSTDRFRVPTSDDRERQLKAQIVSMHSTLKSRHIQDAINLHHSIRPLDKSKLRSALDTAASALDDARKILMGSVQTKEASLKEANSRCNCENMACSKAGAHEPGGCGEKAGKKRMMYLGPVCDGCGDRSAPEFMLPDERGPMKHHLKPKHFLDRMDTDIDQINPETIHPDAPEFQMEPEVADGEHEWWHE